MVGNENRIYSWMQQALLYHTGFSNRINSPEKRLYVLSHENFKPKILFQRKKNVFSF